MSDIFTQLKRARLLGHPIHSMLVHFPSALFPMSWVFDILALWFHSTCLACAAFYSIAAGLLLGLMATIVGSIDYVRLPAIQDSGVKSGHWTLTYSVTR